MKFIKKLNIRRIENNEFLRKILHDLGFATWNMTNVVQFDDDIFEVILKSKRKVKYGNK